MSKPKEPDNKLDLTDPSRRDFLTLTACAVGAVGAGAAALPFINSMNPAADVLALASVDVEVKDLQPGQGKTIVWRGKPVFIRHRTADEIKIANATSLKALPDPQTDQERFSKDPNWLVVVGVCTHLGCVPNERKSMDQDHEQGGWLCACHGSKYDASGRIVSGPAPKNLEVPPYQFINNGSAIRIG
jgi:ubiquinol-cytochrome c reductase iron-sulfur subunit